MVYSVNDCLSKNGLVNGLEFDKERVDLFERFVIVFKVFKSYFVGDVVLEVMVYMF